MSDIVAEARAALAIVPERDMDDWSMAYTNGHRTSRFTGTMLRDLLDRLAALERELAEARTTLGMVSSLVGRPDLNAYPAVAATLDEMKRELAEARKQLMDAACVMGSPKDAHRLADALGYVLASYRHRGEQAETALAALREAFARYARHDDDCGPWAGGCRCGYAAAKDAWARREP